MNCSRVQNHLSAYCDRELTGAEMLAIQRHLSRCPECRRELESVRNVKAMLGCLGRVEPRGTFHPALLDGAAAALRVRTGFWSRWGSRLRLAMEPVAAPLGALLDTLALPLPARVTQVALSAAACVAIGSLYLGLLLQPQHPDAVSRLVPVRLDVAESETPLPRLPHAGEEPSLSFAQHVGRGVPAAALWRDRPGMLITPGRGPAFFVAPSSQTLSPGVMTPVGFRREFSPLP